MDTPYDPYRDRDRPLWERAQRWLDSQRQTPRTLDAAPSNKQIADEFWQWVAQHRDLYSALMHVSREHPYRRYLGLDGDDNGYLLAERDSPILDLGPAGSEKTSSGAIPNTLLAPGPAVVASARGDIALNTVAMRSRVGTCWHFSPTGPAPYGLKEQRWSPISGSEDFTFALASGHRWAGYDSLTAAARHGNTGANPFFRRAAGDLLGVLFFWTAMKALGR